MTTRKNKSNKPNKKIVENIECMKYFDKKFYELQIASIEKKIVDIEAYSKNNNAELEDDIKYLTENRTDDLANLNAELNIKSMERKNLQKELDKMITDRVTEKHQQQENFEKQKYEFKKSYEICVSDIKMLTSKLTLLNEFHDKKSEFYESYEKIECSYNEREQKHIDNLETILQQLNVHKYKVKEDVDKQLLSLSNNFTKLNNLNTSLHIQRLIRENIALDNEMDGIHLMSETLDTENNKFLVTNRIRNFESYEYRMANVELINKCSPIIMKIINVLNEYVNVQNQIEQLTKYQKNIGIIEKKFTHIENQSKSNEFLVNLIKQKIHAGQCEYQFLKLTYDSLISHNDMLENYFEIIKMHNEMIKSFEEKNIANSTNNKFEIKFQRSEFNKYPNILLTILEQFNNDELKNVLSSRVTVNTFEKFIEINKIKSLSQQQLSLSSSINDLTNILSEVMTTEMSVVSSVNAKNIYMPSSIINDYNDNITKNDKLQINDRPVEMDHQQQQQNELTESIIIDVETSSEELVFETSEDEIVENQDEGLLDEDNFDGNSSSDY